MAKSKNKKTVETLRSNRAVLGLLRKQHFESGGDLPSWRGRADVYVNRKKKKNKYACRKRNVGEW